MNGKAKGVIQFLIVFLEEFSTNVFEVLDDFGFYFLKLGIATDICFHLVLPFEQGGARYTADA